MEKRILYQIDEFFYTGKIAIESTDTIDIYEIEETAAPDGYIGLNKKILLEVYKKINGSKYEVDKANIYLIDKTATIDYANLSKYTKNEVSKGNKYKYTENNKEVYTIAINENGTNINIDVVNKKVDLALRKTITQVADIDSAGNVTKTYEIDRKKVTDTTWYNVSDLASGKYNNATYNMNKKPIEVKIGQEVSYALMVFNEGEVPAKALEINDYIPVGFKVTGVYYKNGTTKLTQSNTMNNSNLKNKNYYYYDEANGMLNIRLGETSLIKEFDGKTLSYDYVTVKGIVDSKAEGVLTNVSEIRKYKIESGEIEKDLDSTSDNWVSPNYPSDGLNNIETDKSTINWREYTNEHPEYTNGENNSIVSQDSSINGYKGDDDDFEKIVVSSVDLALKKVIKQVADVDSDGNITNVMAIDRPESEEKSWVNIVPLLQGKTDALYNMNKTPVNVKRGQYVTYGIYVFNEGQIDARAIDIADYIPAGLEVVGVTYRDVKLRSIGEPASVTQETLDRYEDSNYYYYEKENKMLRIHTGLDKSSLSGTDIPKEGYDCIPAFDGNTLSYDYVTVTCKVLDEAEGILTNVAEITTYKNRVGIYEKDIDSISANWKGVTGDKNSSAIKDKNSWINYAKGKSNLLDGSWHTEFIGGKYNEVTGEEDDDDFEKVQVIEDYKVQIQKVSGANENNKLEGIKFAITSNIESLKDKYTVEKDGSILLTTNSEGKTEIIEADIFANNDEDVFYIVEKEIPEGANYNLIDTIFELRIKKLRDGVTGVNKIVSYSFVKKGEEAVYKNLSSDSIVTVQDVEGNIVYIRANYNSNENKFVINVPNNVSSSNYKMQLLKVSNKINSEDTEKPIQGLEFAINTKQEPIKTNKDGMIDFGIYEINQNNYKDIDEYTITEVTGTTNENSRYYLLNEKIKVYVKKDLVTTFIDDKVIEDYRVVGISADGQSFTKFDIVKTVKLKNTDKTVDVVISLDNNVITVKVPNIEKEGIYNLLLKKVDAKNNTLKDANVKFTINGEGKTLETGITELVSGKEISAVNYKTPDKYTIIETQTAEGYSKLKYPITLTVNKDDTGEEYIVSNVVFENGNTSNIVNRGEIKTISNIELENNTSVSIIVDLQNENSIILTVPNNKLTGKYNLEIYKYSIDKDGVKCEVPGMAFGFIKWGTTSLQQRSTNAKGLAGVTNIPITEEGTQTFDISEIRNNEGKYIYLNESIRVNITTSKNENGTKYIVSDANFENGTKKVNVLLVNGETVEAKLTINNDSDGTATIRISVENPPISGKYLLDLYKYELKNNNPIEDISFHVKETLIGLTTEHTTANNGRVTVEEKEITYENVCTTDEYEIKEISPENSEDNKYIKLKYPLKLQVVKGLNTTGEPGTVNAPGTKFVVTNLMLLVETETTTLYKQGGTSLTLEGVELEDGTIVSVHVNTEDVNDNGKIIQRIVVNIPNKLIEGKYLVKIKKVNASTSNSPIEGASFKVNATVGGVNKVYTENATGSETKLDRTNSSGFTTIGGEVVLNNTILNPADSYTISEIKIYKSKTSSEINNELVKLVKPVTLTVEKHINNYKYEVKQISLSQEGKTQVTGESSVTLPGVELINGETVDVVVTVNRSENKTEATEVIVQIPNKDITGNYSMNLIKTINNGTPRKNIQFKTSNSTNAKETDNNGEISIVDNYTINKNNKDIPDEYKITEIDNKKDNILALAEPITVIVEKGIGNKEYVVSKITIKSGTQTKVITRENGLNTDNTVTLNNIKTVNSSKDTTVKLILNEITNKITVKVDNPLISGEYALKILKVNSANEEEKLQGATFEVVNDLDVITKTTGADGYAYIFGDDPNTDIIEPKKAIYDTDVNDEINIVETETVKGYELLKYISIDLNIAKKVSQDGTKYIIDKDLTRFIVKPSVGLQAESDEVKAKVNEKIKQLQARINLSITDAEITIIIPNDKIDGSYSLELIKVEEDGTSPSIEMPFSVTKNNKKIVDNKLTNSDGVIYIGTQSIESETTDTYIITENEKLDSKYIQLAEDITIKAKTVINSNKTGYELGEVYFYNKDNTTSKEKTINVKLKDGTTTTAKVSVVDNKISILVKNKKITGQYSVNIKKVVGGVGLPNVIFKVNGVNQTPTDGNGLLKYITNKPITSNDLGNETITIDEIKVDENKYVKLKYPLELTLTKGKDSSGNKYVITNMQLKGIGISSPKTASGTSSISLSGILLKDGNTVTVKANLDEETQTVTVEIPNIEIKGQYSLKIMKINDITKDVIESVKFKVSGTVNGEEIDITTPETNSSGITEVNNVTINSEKLKEDDIYTIKEILIGEEYIKLKEELNISVTKGIDGDKFIAESIMLYQGENRSAKGKEVTLQNVKLEDESTVSIPAEISDENEILVTIPNKKIEGSYNLKLIKYDEEFNNRLGNVQFEFTTNDGKTKSTKRDKTSPVPANSNGTQGGEINIGSYTITKENWNDVDDYTIKEILVAGDEYLKLAEPINISISKIPEGNLYVVKDVTVSNSSETVTLGKEINETEVILHNLKTNNINRTADVKVSIDRNTQNIVIEVENPKLKGDYAIQILKIDSQDSSKKLVGAEFDVRNPKGVNSTVITQNNGIGYVVGDNIYTQQKEENYAITELTNDSWRLVETKAPADYQLLNDFAIDLQVKTRISNDKTKYVVEDAIVSISQIANSNKYDSEFKKMLTEGVNASVNADGTLITITIPNESTIDYKFKMVKQDDEGNSIRDAKFTVKGPDGSSILNDEVLPNGSYFVKDYTDVKINNKYEFLITETSAPIGYVNLLKDLNLRVKVAIDNSGRIDVLNSSIDIVPLTENYDKETYMLLQKHIDDKIIKITSEKSTQSLLTDDTVVVTIVNPIDKKEFNLSLLKDEIDSNNHISGVEFDVTYLSEENRIVSYETDLNGKFEIDDKQNIKYGTTFNYVIEETSTPGEFIRVVKKAFVTIQITDNGELTGNITKIVLEKETPTANDIEVVYDANIYGKYVKLEKEGTNKYIVHWFNSAQYQMVIHKRAYHAGVNDLRALEIIDDATFNVVEEIASNGANQTVINSLSTSGGVYVKKDVRTNTSYKYTINEIGVPDGYENDFEDVNIIVEIRVDNEGKIIDKNSNGTGSRVKLEAKDGSMIPITKYIELINKVSLKVNTTDNTVELDIADTPIVPEPEVYNLQLVKVDKNDRNKKIKDVEFSVSVNLSPYQVDGKNPKTNEDGILTIGDINFNAHTTDYIVIEEIDAPEGYEVLENVEITLQVKKSGLANASELRPSNITLSIGGPNAALLNEEDVEINLTEDKTIQIVIPNKSIGYKFVINKKDTSGNLITADIDDQGNIDATYIDVKQGGEVIYDEEPLITGTITFDKVGAAGTQRLFNVDEVLAKSGYKNVLKGWTVYVSVSIDSYGIVLDENNGTRLVFMAKTADDRLSLTEVEKYVSLKVRDTDGDGIKEVILDIVNPREYKLKLTKVDTSPEKNPINSANIIIEQIVDNNPQVSVEMNAPGSSTNTNIMETPMTTIKEGEIQKWVVRELSVNSPFHNILENREIQITTEIKDGQLIYNYDVHEKDASGNDIILARSNEIYNRFLKINLVVENGQNIIEIELKNPIKYIFKLEKIGMSGNSINVSRLEVNGVTNETNNMELDSSIELLEKSKRVNQTIQYKIKEKSVEAPYVNILGENTLYLEINVKEDNTIAISGKGYYDVNGNKYNGWSKFENYIIVSIDTDRQTGMQVVKLQLKNPMKYKLKLYKIDENNTPVSGAKIELADSTEILSNNGNDYIEKEIIEESTLNSIYVREIESALGYVNNLKNKEIRIKFSTRNNIINVYNEEVFDLVNNTSETGFNTIQKYFRYSVTQSEDASDKIPVIEMYITNTIKYDLNIIKQNTNGVEYDGARLQLELCDVKDENNNNIEISNIKDTGYESRISQNDLEIVPNRTYSYIVKEIRTGAPHINILENKLLKFTVRMEKDVTTGEMNLVYNYDVCDEQNNILPNDPAREFIEFEAVKNQITGKYTLNLYIKNPIEFKMSFAKTDLAGNELINKATISINGKINNGKAEETYTNASIGEIYNFIISEENTKAPFVNILGNNKIKLTLRVNENEKISVISAQYIDVENGNLIEIPENIKKYLTYNIVQDHAGVQTLNIQLKNPIEYKIKITKQDMSNLGLKGANIRATFKGQKYSNNGSDFIEIPVTDIEPNVANVLTIKEISSKENFDNVFEDAQIFVIFIVRKDQDDEYRLSVVQKFMLGTATNNVMQSIPSQYFEYEIDNAVNDKANITAYIKLKNPIKYDFEVVKIDLSDEEISGTDLQMKVTKNSEQPVYNNGSSTIRFEERDLVPNIVNKYVIEELSTIAPHVNTLKDKKLTVEVRVDENGKLIIQKCEVTNKEGVPEYNEYIAIDTTGFSNDGTRLIKVKLKNPLTYIYRLTKTDMHGNEITSANIQVNDVLNIDTTENPAQITPSITILKQNVKAGQLDEFIVSELSAQAPYVNVLGETKIKFIVRMNYNERLSIVNVLRINKDGSVESLGDLSDYIDYDIVTDESTGIQTLDVKLKNPMNYKLKLYKIDDNNRPVLNSNLQIISKENGITINENGESYIEKTILSSSKEDTIIVREVASAEGYNNDLSNKSIKFVLSAENGQITIPFATVLNESGNIISGGLSTVHDIFEYNLKQANETPDKIPVLEMHLKNKTDYSMNIFKQTSNGMPYDGAKLELYKLNDDGTRQLIKNNIENSEKQSNISLENIAIKPNETHNFVFKEVSTEAPHVNVLEDKEIRFAVKLEKNEDTSELNMICTYDVYDENGNVLVNDISKQYIRFVVAKNNATGKYTLNLYIINPIEFKMKFTKTDTLGNEISGKTIITINGKQNTGSAEEVYKNLSIGDTVTLIIGETSAEVPFENILGNDKIMLVARVMENEKIQVIAKKYMKEGSTEWTTIPEEMEEYLSYEVVTGNDGIQVLDIKLKNPSKFKVKINKQDMAGLGLTGADITATYNGVSYSMEGKDYIEIPVNSVAIGQGATIIVSENSSKENYENVFKGKKLIFVFGINTNYSVMTFASLMLDYANGGQILDIPTKYVTITADNSDSELGMNITLKNPINYNLEVIKTDLSGNTISGDELQIKVTRNDETPVENEGKSTIKFTQTDLSPNAVNTYVVEELSTLAPHVNELKDKKLTAQVRVDENGKLIMQKFEVTNSKGEIVASDYVSYDTASIDTDGTRLVKIYVKNPLEYRLKLLKTITQSEEQQATGTIAEGLEGTSIQVDNISNNESSNLELKIENVKIGDTKTFIIKETASTGAHINLLKNKEILLTTIMNTDKKVYFQKEQLRDTQTGEIIEITEDIKEEYRFDYTIVTDDDGVQTVIVIIQNPIKFNVKVVKKDATGITEFSGANLELRKEGQLLVDNKEDGSAILEYVQENAGIDDEYTFSVYENASVSPNVNILKGKSLEVEFKIGKEETIEILNSVLKNKVTNQTEELNIFEKVSVVEIDGVQTLLIELINPVEFDFDLVKNAAGVGFLQNTKFQVYNEEEMIFDDYVTDINTWKTAEITETNVMAGRHTYYVTETKTARPRYVNILEDKYIKINVEVSGTGKVLIMNNEWQEDETYFEVYEGDIANRKSTDVLIDKSDLIYDCIITGVTVNPSTRKYTISCDVMNPIRYIIELEKVDSVENPLEGAEFEIESSVINEQNATKTEMEKTEGVDKITEDGIVQGTTTENGLISYEETYVKVGSYEYTLKEIKTPGEQYVNPFEGYVIHFKIKVDRDGDLELEFYENGRKIYIEKDGVEAPEDLYEYITLDIKNNLIIAKLHIEVENPVRYNFKLEKDIYGTDNLNLPNAEFVIESSLIKEQSATKTNMAKTEGVKEITSDGKISGITNEEGNISFEETMVRPGIYEYWIKEIQTGDEDILNALEDKYIKLYAKVSSNGKVDIVSEDGQIIEGIFYLYEADRTQKIDFEKSSIDELINIYTTETNEVYTIHVEIKNPQKYSLKLIKTDIDTLLNMNDVVFEIKAYKEGSTEDNEIVEEDSNEENSNEENSSEEDSNEENSKDEEETSKENNIVNLGEEIKLRKAYKNTEAFDLSELITSSIEEVDGVISIEDILIEGAGTYYIEFIETTPLEPIIYKDKSENVIVKIVIGIENGKYKLTDIEVVQGKKYVINENTNIEDSLINVNITNERIKGSYDLSLLKLEELLGKPIKGAEFVIEAFELEDSKDNKGSEEKVDEKTKEEIEKEEQEDNNKLILYKSTDDVTSMDELIPTKFVINDENGIYEIEKIRIENLNPYILQITETKAPDTYTALRNPIKLKVTPGIKGKFDDAKFIIESLELIEGENDGLVVFDNTEEKIELTITNNQFDLALRKYITSVNDKDISRWTEPEVDTSKLITGESTTAEYYNSKQPIRVYTNHEIIYTLRVYNEGQIDGYANEIVDHLPEYLEFLPDDEFNKSREWTYVEGNTRKIKTNYLSKEVNEKDNLIKAFNAETGEIDYVEVQVKCKVKPTAVYKELITNIAEITKYEAKDRPNAQDRDSFEYAKIPEDENLPNYKQDEIDEKYVPGQEDDDDFEKIFVEEFDLALKKWVSQAIVTENGKERVVETGHTGEENPEPVVKVDIPNTSLNTIKVKFRYQIKVTNEGVIPGYVKEISDYIPAGLKFVQEDNPTWKQEDGKVVTNEVAGVLLNPGESVSVTIVLTWINSKDNLGTKVNVAEISEDYNNYDDLEDKDSTPDNIVYGEDDIDVAPVILAIKTGEKAKVYYIIAIAAFSIVVGGIVFIIRYFRRH